jgi:hypothetical protein
VGGVLRLRSQTGVARDDTDRRFIMRLLLIALHILLSVAATGAGQAFVRDPSGGTMGMSANWLQGSPFPDYRFPGIFLAVVIGGANAASALLLLKRHPFSPAASLSTGLLMVGWLAIQTAIIGIRHWSQGIWWLLFPFVAVLAGILARRRH